MLRKEDVAEVLQRPEVLGRLVGFTDLTALHGEWIHEMVFGEFVPGGGYSAVHGFVSESECDFSAEDGP